MTESDREIRRSAPKRVDHIDAEFAVLACLADVHGNTVALDAVLASEGFARAGAVAFLDCSTTGPDPQGVLELCRNLPIPVFHLVSNGERLGAGICKWHPPVRAGARYLADRGTRG